MEFFWENEGWELGDKHLVMLEKMPFRREFLQIPKDPGLYVVRGPRQVGKSCYLKKVLSHYSAQRSCFYLSCEEISDYKELGEILRSVRQREIILLDEVTYVESWDRAVKNFVDSNIGKILIITGSHSHDLKRGADRMPGRYEAGGELFILPMDFFEFQKIRSDIGWTSAKRLDEILCYFRVGGFPLAVAEGGPHGKKPKQALQTYWRWLAGDFVRLGKQEIFLSELLGQIALTLQTPVSFQSLTKRTSISSHNTTQEYLSVLESCFALKTLHCMDPDTGAFRFRKDKKFYFTDPLLFHLAREKLGLNDEPEDEVKIAEMVAHEHLSRRFPRFGYFSSGKGEIDFYLPRQWAIELKWSQVASNLSKAYHSQILPWKKVWTQENYLLDYPAR